MSHSPSLGPAISLLLTTFLGRIPSGCGFFCRPVSLRVPLLYPHVGFRYNFPFCLSAWGSRSLFASFFFLRNCFRLILRGIGGNGKDLHCVLLQGAARHQFQKLCEENKIGHRIGPPSLFRNFIYFSNCGFLKTTHNIKFTILTVFKIIQLNSVKCVHMVVQLVFKTFPVSQTETYPLNLSPFRLLL